VVGRGTRTVESNPRQRARGVDPTLGYSPRLAALFTPLVHTRLRRHFSAVRLVRDTPRPDVERPTILYCNHPSWWDPLVLLALCRSVFPGQRVFGPMDPVALGRYSILRRVGCFPVAPGTLAGARAFLDGAACVLAAPGQLLAVTAEGRFSDARARPVRLQPGVAHLLAADSRCQAIPVALEYVFWNERAPEVLVRLGSAVSGEGAGRSRSEVSVIRGRLEAALADAQDRLAVAAAARDPARFDVVLAGSRSGVGGVYDWYERLRAWWRGEPFDPSHGALGR